MNRELLHSFFEGKTTIDQEIEIRKWLENSTSNEAQFIKERQYYDLSLFYPLIETEEKIKRQNRRLSAKNLFVSFARIAAIVTLTLLASYTYTEISDQQTISMQTISVPVGQRINIDLPDGTNVWLNAMTTIKYPVNFNSSKRTVMLDGEAYFNVKENTKIPFEVKTSKGRIEVLGTEFNLQAYSSDSALEAALMEGSILIGANEQPNSVKLTPNNKATLSNGNIKVTPITDMHVYSWKDGLLSFREESFDKMMRSFQKSYDVTIIIENTNVSNRLFTGKFRMTDGIDYSLKVLQENIDFSFTRDIENNIIHIK